MAPKHVGINIGLWAGILGSVAIAVELILTASNDFGFGAVVAFFLFFALNAAAFGLIVLLAAVYGRRSVAADLILAANAVIIYVLRDGWIAEVGPDAQAAVSIYLVIPIYVILYSFPLNIVFCLLSMFAGKEKGAT